MGAQIFSCLGDDHGEIFSCTYRGLDDIKGIVLRAALDYLRDLSAKNLSKDLLVTEGILDAHAEVDEVVAITNYRIRIDDAFKLLSSWRREQTGDGEMDWTLLSSNSQAVPIADWFLGPEAQFLVGSVAGLNLPYRIERIPMTMPPVLSELNLKGLHHYIAHHDEFSYEQAQDIAAFLDKMKPYLKFDWRWDTPEGPIGEQLRTVFMSCKEGGTVHIG